MEIKDGKVILNEDEAVLFGSLLQGLMQGINSRIDKGGYLSKDERSFTKEAQKTLEKLEENDII